MKVERSLIFILFISLAGVAAIHKVLSSIPPNWFVTKFQDSLLGSIPGGISGSFVLITVLEFGIAALFILAFIRREFLETSDFKFANYGLLATLSLFVILFFGSFLVQDYDNGFKDFTYFGLTLWMKSHFFTKKNGN